MYKNEAFDVGNSFYRVACDCVPDDFLDNDEDDGHWFVPHVVLLAFACELFLKSLLSDGDSEFSGHNLFDLFSKLDETTKGQIQHSASFDGDEQFLSKLKEASNCFQDWRYYFEKNKSAVVDVVFMENLADTLWNIAKDCVSEDK